MKSLNLAFFARVVSLAMTRTLNRIRTSVVNAINARVKLPKLIVIVLKQDFIEALQIAGSNTYVSMSASMYGTWLEWLSEEVAELLKSANEALPVKARRPQGEPVVYWVAATTHRSYPYELRVQIAKFNNCMDSVMKVRQNMRVIKLKQGWSSEDSNLVTRIGKITHSGLDQIWEALDSSVKFNFNKRLEFLAKSAKIYRK